MKFILPLIVLLAACTSTSKASIANPNSVDALPTKPIITTTSQEKGEITGVVKDEYGEALPFAKVILLVGEKIITGTNTDLDGNFKISNISPGEYDIEVNYVGYSSKKIEGIIVKEHQKIDFVMISMPGEEIILLKPIIYLYPETELDVNVSLNYDGQLTHTYPFYPIGGWNVMASPEGTLWDSKGQEYYSLLLMLFLSLKSTVISILEAFCFDCKA